MKNHLMLAILLLSCLVGIAVGSAVYWAEGGMPARVVIGTLTDIEEDAFFLEASKGTVRRVYWDSGWIEVERVLEGYLGHERVPVVWCARSESQTPNAKTRSLVISSMAQYEGERRIWVLFTPGRFAEPHNKHHEFQSFPVDSLSRIENELEELRKMDRNSILD